MIPRHDTVLQHHRTGSDVNPSAVIRDVTAGNRQPFQNGRFAVRTAVHVENAADSVGVNCDSAGQVGRVDGHPLRNREVRNRETYLRHSNRFSRKLRNEADRIPALRPGERVPQRKNVAFERILGGCHPPDCRFGRFWKRHRLFNPACRHSQKGPFFEVLNTEF